MSEPTRNLTCCCCGASTRGRQWHNRDTGFGLCVECAKRIEAKMLAKPHLFDESETMERLYGVRGVHYDLEFQQPQAGGAS